MKQIPLSTPSRHAVRLTALTLLGTTMYLALWYPSLPWLLPVHFKAGGVANGWQYKTLARVLTPALIQAALFGTFGAIAALLLSRTASQSDSLTAELPSGGADAPGVPVVVPAVAPAMAPDVRAASVAAETVLLMSCIWVAFQAYAAYAVVRMWTTEVGHLGAMYNVFEWTGLILTGVVAVRGHVRLGRPMPRPYVAEHWRLGQLYKNPNDPALFVPTRDGARWTLNFGRPVAAALLGVVLMVGVVGPTLILVLTLRYNF